ncbi:MAG: serine hydrolase [Burkholderiaceae bacterium]|nr:serine hydrolase [Burkholderiaceae bacterium]
MPASPDTNARWMHGFPPPPERQIRFEDLHALPYPAHRWLYSHYREIMPTARVWRGAGAPRTLPRAERPLGGFAFDDPDGGRCTLDEALLRTATDGLLVLHDGKLLFERYLGELQPHRTHRCFSVTKSFAGLLAATAAHEGLIDPAARVAAYLPELAESGWADATVREVMDMTSGMAFDEDYADPNGDVVRSRRANGSLPRPPGYDGPRGIYEYLATMRTCRPHGEGFHYVTPNTNVLAWILQRATETPLATLVSERLWQRIGAEEDGDFAIDPVGIADAGGGLCVTLRDLARLGEVMRNRGRVDGDQVIPAAVIDDITAGADREKFTHAGYAMFDGWSYRNQWWISHDAFGAIRCLGIYGQQLYVAPKAGLVIARFGSQEVAVDEGIEKLLMSAFAGLAQMLAG